jgi:uncharacterized RDD family membrane protein YckC
MMFDTVREELQTKITSGPLAAERRTIEPPLERKPLQTARTAMPVTKRPATAALAASKTSPTLVEFQNKNASLPDWRLQLQNAVQQRKGAQTSPAEVAAAPGTQFNSNGSAALKVEPAPRPEPENLPEISDPRVANAMRRINESRNTFLDSEHTAKRVPVAKKTPARPYRFDVVPVNKQAPATATATAPAREVVHPKPTLVNPVPPAVKRDTNKLPPIEKLRTEPAITEEVKIDAPVVPAPEFHEIKRITIKVEDNDHDFDEIDEIETDEIEDLAPYSMRFSAALFDLIISTFAAGLLLSPLAFAGGDWFNEFGLMSFVGAWVLVSFLYMTICLGFYGKTVGMRLFSLELVDAVENEYPTLHQAAINSAIFIVSLGFLGAGFLTAFFNEERRALNDLLSGTILVREF